MLIKKILKEEFMKKDPMDKNGLGPEAPSRNQTTGENNVLRHTSGAPVQSNEDTMTAGKRGPSVIEDAWLFEKHANFNREVIPERRMHAKGSGAYGTFTCTNDISKYTKASIFSEVGKKTEMFARFSTVAGERGAADTERDIRGFALKFYTDEGNWDLVGNNTPVFFFRDPKKFIDLNHAVKRDPKTNLRSPNTNWDFWTSLPESLMQVTVVMSDRGIPSSFRFMHGSSSHTYSFINDKNERVWCKIHHISQQGIQNLTDQESEMVVGGDREANQRDLFNAIEQGKFPKWKMYCQIMTEEEAKNLDYNPFDLTKLWYKDDFPFIEIGEFELNRNPENYFAEVEQAAFNPATIVPGISYSPDRMLQARLVMYSDAQRYRLGVNHYQIPVNQPKGLEGPVQSFHRDGQMRVDGNFGGQLHYSPNSYGALQDNPNQITPAQDGGDVFAYDFREDDHDYFTQPGKLFRAMNEDQQLVLFENTARNMGDSTLQIKHRHIRNCYHADEAYGKGVAKALNIDINDVNLDFNPMDSREKWQEANSRDQDLNKPTEKVEVPESAKDLPPQGRDTNYEDITMCADWQKDPYIL